mmetsp:Transcript_92395/g.298627  ORF Transcript_92395/g.298627 Transcript_92395/m.298627 type:complete len:115 (+) Transcript_92395:303-647(+)
MLLSMLECAQSLPKKPCDLCHPSGRPGEGRMLSHLCRLLSPPMDPTSSKAASDVDMVNYPHSVFVVPATKMDGKITWSEFQPKFDEPKMRSYFKSIHLDVSEAKHLREADMLLS